MESERGQRQDTKVRAQKGGRKLHIKGTPESAEALPTSSSLAEGLSL